MRLKLAGLLDTGLAAWRTFWSGFTSPSIFSLSLAFLVSGFSVGLILVVLTPSFIAGPLGAYLPGPLWDQEMFATRKALQISTGTRTPSESPKMYAIGNSIMAHTFVSESALAQSLREVTQLDWRVDLFTTPAQGPYDEAALAEHATARDPGIVVLSVGFARFGHPRSEYVRWCNLRRLGIHSEWSASLKAPICGEPDSLTGIFAWDNRLFLSNRPWSGIFQRLLLGHQTDQKYDIYLSDFTATPARRKVKRDVWLKILREGTAEDRFAEALLEHTVRNLKARGNVVMFVETPISDSLLESRSDRESYVNYKKRVASLAKAFGSPYCELDIPGTSDEGFYPDHAHLNDAGAQGLARRKLAECVRQLEVGKVVRDSVS